MKKGKSIAVRIMFTITVLVLLGLGLSGYRLHKLIKRIDYQVALGKQELSKNKKQLEQLQLEVTQIDTPEYIEKVAREELGMVKKEDIIFKEK